MDSNVPTNQATEPTPISTNQPKTQTPLLKIILSILITIITTPFFFLAAIAIGILIFPSWRNAGAGTLALGLGVLAVSILVWIIIAGILLEVIIIKNSKKAFKYLLILSACSIIIGLLYIAFLASPLSQPFYN